MTEDEASLWSRDLGRKCPGDEEEVGRAAARDGEGGGMTLTACLLRAIGRKSCKVKGLLWRLRASRLPPPLLRAMIAASK